jgi:transcription initiation factor TFIID subunit 7
MKSAQRDEMKEQQRMKKEGIVPEDIDTDPDGGGREIEGEFDDGDLFGDAPAPHIDIG